jgi:hypothetical protein
MIYSCCEDGRRIALRREGCALNGIDYLEVVDLDEPDREQRQRNLKVYFVKTPSDELLKNLTTANIRISGGERVTDIAVDGLEQVNNEEGKLDHLLVHVTPRGDFSSYSLQLVEANTSEPLQLIDDSNSPLLDPQLVQVDFSFKAQCPSKFDCLDRRPCPTETKPALEIDYLAKDYASFRQLLLDRLSALLPDWRERNAADLGITLVELMAYVGDQLSYRQDAIATEAYLGTARQRISVRRHTRLLDYSMHDGCNARVWVQIRLKQSDAPSLGLRLPRLLVREEGGGWTEPEDEPIPGSHLEVLRTQFSTRIGEGSIVAPERFAELVRQNNAEVFEPLHPVTLYPEHNEMRFYTWSNERCCLPRGATKATLADDYPKLQPGDVLIFKEVMGPRTGNPADADLQHRHAVRLTRVNGKLLRPDGTVDESRGRTGLNDPVAGAPITEIEWSEGDALPFPLCLSSITESGEQKNDVSIALGNIVLADHGLTLPEAEPLGAVPKSNPVLAPGSANGGAYCEESDVMLTPPRFRPCLAWSPLTHTATISQTQLIAGRRTNRAADPAGTAASAFTWDMERVLPAVRLGDDHGLLWLPQQDLLSSDAFAPEFVVETGNDGRATIRFGDDDNGMRPGEDTRFSGLYRIGNGTRGNIGPESLTNGCVQFLTKMQDPGTGGQALADLQPAADFIDSITNPLPASGGREPETIEQARQYAPAAFRVNLRAVTPNDYARIAEQHPEVQSATATLRWTGSWNTIFLTVDRLGGRSVDAAFEEVLRRHLEPFRMAGQDLEIDGPLFISLELQLEVCVLPHYFRTDVEAVLRDVFSNRLRPDGTRGFFHPDEFTFGQPVYVSRIYAAAQKVAGVSHVDVTVLRRLGVQNPEVPAGNILEMGRLEIVRLDHDPNHRERGVLTIHTRGGR